MNPEEGGCRERENGPGSGNSVSRSMRAEYRGEAGEKACPGRWEGAAEAGGWSEEGLPRSPCEAA